MRNALRIAIQGLAFRQSPSSHVVAHPATDKISQLSEARNRLRCIACSMILFSRYAPSARTANTFIGANRRASSPEDRILL